MTDPTDSKEPVAGLSAASSCIRISLRPSTSADEELPPFRPVYTHQCFDNECITGWRPMPEAEDQSKQIYQSWKESGNDGKLDELHKSYDNCCHDEAQAEGRIDLNLVLAPSCEHCQVVIQTERYEPPPPKVTEDYCKEPAPKKKKIVSFVGIEPDKDAEDDTPNEKKEQLVIADIVEKLSMTVPPIVSVKLNGTLNNDMLPTKNDDNQEGGADIMGYLAKPIGKVFKKYNRKIKGGNNSTTTEEAKFVITMADGSKPEVSRYHNAIQPLARWFIETADDVDISDTSRGSWKVMYLFREHTESTFSFVGYITLLHIHSPFRKPRSGTIVRVCQALILPPYHRAGHGSTMLHSLFEYADDAAKVVEEGATMPGMDIIEVNVEDPAPAFVALRDCVDYQRFVAICDPSKAHEPASNDGHGKNDKLNFEYLAEHDVTNKANFLPISDDNLASVADTLKITKHQVQIIHEIYKLSQVEKWKQSLPKNDDKSDELIKQVETYYRLMVKRSLRAHRIEELGACDGDKEKQKALLGEWFDQTYSHYHRLLGCKSKS